MGIHKTLTFIGSLGVLKLGGDLQNLPKINVSGKLLSFWTINCSAFPKFSVTKPISGLWSAHTCVISHYLPGNIWEKPWGTRGSTPWFVTGNLRILVGGLEHQFYFSIYWEFHHPNWLTRIVQRAQPSTRTDFHREYHEKPIAWDSLFWQPHGRCWEVLWISSWAMFKTAGAWWLVRGWKTTLHILGITKIHRESRSQPTRDFME